jgi:hypothetical protein
MQIDKNPRAKARLPALSLALEARESRSLAERSEIARSRPLEVESPARPPRPGLDPQLPVCDTRVRPRRGTGVAVVAEPTFHPGGLNGVASTVSDEGSSALATTSENEQEVSMGRGRADGGRARRHTRVADRADRGRRSERDRPRRLGRGIRPGASADGRPQAGAPCRRDRFPLRTTASRSCRMRDGRSVLNLADGTEAAHWARDHGALAPMQPEGTS